jgi:hypothetical protein
MARHKLASNVCEKALAHADPEARHALIEEIMGPPSKPDATLIAVMIKDAYGSGCCSARVSFQLTRRQTMFSNVHWALPKVTSRKP